ncbi:hypothetical protein ZWY2020_000001 [Hordeum vulgare]|nr:hypothetical protein ZWY2020_000001 [Hordeum vulgare]
MAYAVPPGEDDGLLSVLELALADRRHPLPAWVSKDDLYRDLPQTIAANCFQSTDGAGRPAWYVLTPLRAIGGRTRRTVYGAGYWKVERTTAIFLSQGGEPSSPKPAPDGSCVKLSFILRPHNGPEGRNGWLMKQYLLTKAPVINGYVITEWPKNMTMQDAEWLLFRGSSMSLLRPITSYRRNFAGLYSRGERGMHVQASFVASQPHQDPVLGSIMKTKCIHHYDSDIGETRVICLKRWKT